jgi:hypothetical protein
MTDSCTEWHVQEHCHGGETDLQCGNTRVILTTRLPTDIAEYLHINVGLHFTPAELICYAQYYACFKKRSACISNRNEHLWFSLGLEMMDSSTKKTCFVSVISGIFL